MEKIGGQEGFALFLAIVSSDGVILAQVIGCQFGTQQIKPINRKVNFQTVFTILFLSQASFGNNSSILVVL